jgi:hypothetical protein
MPGAALAPGDSPFEEEGVMVRQSSGRLNRRSAAAGFGALGLGALVAPHGMIAQEATPIVDAETPACAADPRLGDAVAITGPEGSEVLRVRANDMRDPFLDYDPAGAPQAGRRYVVLSLTADVVGPRPVVVDPRQILLQDAEGYLYEHVNVRLPQGATEAMLARGELSPGSRVQGLLAYAVLRDVALARLFYQPERLRLLLLADLR